MEGKEQEVGCLLASNPTASTHSGPPLAKLLLLLWEGAFFSALSVCTFI